MTEHQYNALQSSNVASEMPITVHALDTAPTKISKLLVVDDFEPIGKCCVEYCRIKESLVKMRKMDLNGSCRNGWS